MNTARRLAPLSMLLALACASPGAEGLEGAAEETGVEGPFEQLPADVAADGASPTGPAVAAGAATEVWAVRNQWDDTTTADARLAGIAWAADSGLTWEEKFDRWIGSMEIVTRQGYGRTFRIRTPQGDRSFDAPTLECAETAMFLRATFASWYALPFFMTGWDSSGRQAMYAGHFGFVTSSGARLARFPSFRTDYRDYTSSYRAGQAWPTDARLRGMHLGTDDEVVFLSTPGTTAGAGTYFDELFLNKRVGYFMRLLLLYFGSANVSDGANSMQIQPEALAPGDMLIERWQRQGIGHVMPIFRRADTEGGHFDVSIASGSMPRRQPLWADTAEARHYFTAAETGGEGTNTDGDAYARLGGGLRRWRTPVLSGGRWRNQVRAADRSVMIAETDYATIGARPAHFGELLSNATPEQRRDAAISRLTNARRHLAMYPASCSARTQREDAMNDLYAVMEDFFGEDRATVDRHHRTLEDYVFAELEYTRSRTCCWNSTTAAMEAIIVQYAQHEQEVAAAAGTCVAPTIFRAEQADRDAGGDGYARWRTYAASIGRAADWRAWSEDETCSGRDAHGDSVTARNASIAGFCTLGGGSTTACDPVRDDGATSSAPTLARGAATNARICASDADYYRVDGGSAGVSVVVRFTHANGDLDVEAVSASGAVLATSAGTTNEERVRATGVFYVRVFGYGGATNDYTIAIE
jgi:hypothetical protein